MVFLTPNPYKLNLRRLRFYLGPTCHSSFVKFKRRAVPCVQVVFTSPPIMSSTPASRRPMSLSPTYSSDSPSKPATPSHYPDDISRFAPPDTDPMLFELDDYGSSSPATHLSWDMERDVKPRFEFSGSSLLSAFDLQHMSPADSGYFDGEHVDINVTKGSPSIDNLFLANWINDPDLSSPSSPISIPSSVSPHSPSFVAYNDQSHFPGGGTFSPTEFAALHPLPRSISPSSSFEEYSHVPRQRVHSISPLDTRLHGPSWASQIFDGSLRPPSSSRPALRHSPLADSTMRQRRGSMPSAYMFQSSSAPSVFEPRGPPMTRSYSRRAESETINDEQDSTVRRKKRSPPIEDLGPSTRANDSRQFYSFLIWPIIDMTLSAALKSVLRPPKLAPSAWQLYFTDWIQKQQATGTRKLNVAQAAKEAGQEYACLSAEEKEVIFI
jgi:hypothetical protein